MRQNKVVFKHSEKLNYPVQIKRLQLLYIFVIIDVSPVFKQIYPPPRGKTYIQYFHSFALLTTVIGSTSVIS